jgi:hypothetical protein
MAVFHCCWTVAVMRDRLKSWAIGEAKTGAPMRKNHVGSCNPSALPLHSITPEQLVAFYSEQAVVMLGL